MPWRERPTSIVSLRNRAQKERRAIQGVLIGSGLDAKITDDGRLLLWSVVGALSPDDDEQTAALVKEMTEALTWHKYSAFWDHKDRLHIYLMQGPL